MPLKGPASESSDSSSEFLYLPRTPIPGRAGTSARPSALPCSAVNKAAGQNPGHPVCCFPIHSERGLSSPAPVTCYLGHACTQEAISKDGSSKLSPVEVSVERGREHLRQSHPVSFVMTLNLWPVCLCCLSARIPGCVVTDTCPGASSLPGTLSCLSTV